MEVEEKEEEQELMETGDDSLMLEEDFDEVVHEEEEQVRLTGKQKVIVGLTVLFTFLVFFVVFLPRETILRYTLNKFRRVLVVDFRTAEVGFFGAKIIQGLRLNTPRGSNYLSAETVKADISIWELINKHPHGVISMKKVDLGFSSIGAGIKSVIMKVDVDNVMEPVTKWKGTASIKTGPIRLSALPPALLAKIPIPIKAEDIRIKEIFLKTKLRGGEILLTGSRLRSNLVNVTLKGDAKATRSILSARLNAELCLRAAPNLEKENKTIFDVFIFAGGSAAGELCFDLKGNINSPKFEKKGGSKPPASVPGA